MACFQRHNEENYRLSDSYTIIINFLVSIINADSVSEQKLSNTAIALRYTDENMLRNKQDISGYFQGFISLIHGKASLNWMWMLVYSFYSRIVSKIQCWSLRTSSFHTKERLSTNLWHNKTVRLWDCKSKLHNVSLRLDKVMVAAQN